jgi:hypothetical protein
LFPEVSRFGSSEGRETVGAEGEGAADGAENGEMAGGAAAEVRLLSEAEDADVGSGGSTAATR